MENWRSCVGFEKHYEVSDLGNVKRIARAPGAKVGKCLRPQPNTQGYMSVCLSVNGKVHQRLVHRLICETFHGPPAGDATDVAHANFDRGDNRAANLRWTTAKENTADSARANRLDHGVKRYNAKLTDDAVRAIRKDTRRHKDIAADYGVCCSLIGMVKKNRDRRWRHVE